jgi:hypothetical protein
MIMSDRDRGADRVGLRFRSQSRTEGGDRCLARCGDKTGRRHEVDFGDGPVVVDVSVGSASVQITMTQAGAERSLPKQICDGHRAAGGACRRDGSEKDSAERGLRLV